MAKNLADISKYLHENKDKSFEWGKFDCCLFACDIIVICGGEDFAKEVRGTYSTEIGARRVIKKHFVSIEDAFSSLKEISFNFAQRGDLTLFDTSNGQVMAVKWNNGYLCLSPKTGIGTMIETSKPIKTWRVE